MKHILIFIISLSLIVFSSCFQKKHESTSEINKSDTIEKGIQKSEEKNKLTAPIDICNKCNIELIKQIRLNLDNVNDDKLLLFLSCFNKTCFLNSEFSEAANYTIFILLNNIPEKTLNIIRDNKDQLNYEYIILNLQNPVTEDIDIEGAKQGVQSVKKDDQMKKDLLSALSSVK